MWWCGHRGQKTSSVVVSLLRCGGSQDRRYPMSHRAGLLTVTLALQMRTVLEAQWWLRNLYAVFGGVSPGEELLRVFMLWI